MKPRLVASVLTIVAVGASVLCGKAGICDTHSTSHPFWVTAYYPVWEQQSNLPPDQIDYTAFTNLVQFVLTPTAAGALDFSAPTAVTPQISAPVIVLAHAAGDKVLICVGGSGSGQAFSQAITDANRSTLVSNLVQFVLARGYDGIDIDMEPINDSDTKNFEEFITQLRAALTSADPKLLLTAAGTPAPGGNPAMYAAIAGDFDQINIMTYDLSGTWDGWKTWYNSSLYPDGSTYMINTVPYPSASTVLQRYEAAGIPASKLGIGLAFYGDVWSGADGPTQSITGVTISDLGYNAIMDKYYSPTTYHWDSTAHAPYLSIHNAAPAQNMFISYDDERLCTEKVIYARQHALGGVSIFEIGDGYRPNQPAGSRDALLQAVKKAWKSPIPRSVTLP